MNSPDHAPRVLHVLESLGRGGAEILVRDVLVHATSRQLPFSVVALRGGELEKDFRESGRPFILFERRYAVDLRVVRRLRALIRERDIEVVHCHQPVDGIHGYLAALGTNAKTVLTFHGDPRNQKWKDVVAARFLSRRVARNIAVSLAAQQDICSSIGINNTGRWSVVHNGVDPTRLEYETGDIRCELGLSKEAVLFGMVGNFQPGKDQMCLIRAFQSLHTLLDANLHLVLVGDRSTLYPSLFDKCAAYTQDHGLRSHIHFVGPRADAVAIMRQFDWFVFATVGDTYALALVEAMMSGVPCIVARTSAMIEVTGDEENVVFFTPSDEGSLVASLEYVLTNKNESREKSIQARKWALKNHTIEAHVNKLLCVYDEILSETREKEAD